MSAICSIELKLNRSLLNSNFDGYKLCLNEIPQITEQLDIVVDRVLPDVNQYSLLHAKLYGLHNHLVVENYNNRESIYFVDKSLKIQQYYIDPLINQFVNKTVWQIPLLNYNERKAGCYNVSLKFIDSRYVAVADGMGILYILDHSTYNNNGDGLWQIIFTSSDIIGSDQNFIISDCYKHTDIDEINLLLLTISQKDNNEQYSTILHWVTLIKDHNTNLWNQMALRQLTTKGHIQYTIFEKPNCQAIYIASDAQCEFTLDSENQICKEDTTGESMMMRKKRFTWTQTLDDVTLSFKLNENCSRNNVTITTDIDRIEIKYDNHSLLSGKLYQRIDSNMTCWTLENNILEITLQKTENGLMWPEIVEGSDRDGEYVVHLSTLEQVGESLQSLTSDNEACPPSGITFNSQQVEECDFETDKTTIFQRICCNTHQITHKMNFGSHQILLTVNVDTDLSAAFGIRYDVDTCIFQPKIVDNDFNIEHIGTLHALGYIQASKPQRKFFVCSPDLSYSAISESTKHIFVYYHNKRITSTNQLRNRTTGRIDSIAEQKVISLPTNDDILGIYASNSYLYVLGENFIKAFCI